MNDPSVAALLQRNNELLEILVKLQLKSTLSEELSDPQNRKLYELTGDKPVGHISKELKMAAGKISRTWQRWEQQGLLIKDGRSYKRVI